MLDYGLDSEEVDLVLKTDADKCKVCKIGDVVPCYSSKENQTMIIYTREGTKIATHYEYRCNNRTKLCRAGHYYGYVTMGEKANTSKPRCYEYTALKKPYLVTSNQTAFSITYLWDCLLQIVFSNASFESLAKVFNNLHFVNLPMDVMQRRIEVHRKRIADAVFLFAYLELGQRYGLSPIITGGIDETVLMNKAQIRDKFRNIWSVDHCCDIKGCNSVIVIHGGMKPTRSLCAAKLNGVKEFRKSGVYAVWGCTKAPQPNSKFCGDHVSISSPAIPSDQVSAATRNDLREYRKNTANFKDAPQDNIYVVEALLEKRIEKNSTYWKVQWLGFPLDESTWEPEKNIQPWIVNYYCENIGRLVNPLPQPKIKHSKRAGNEIYYYLSWDGREDLSG